MSFFWSTKPKKPANLAKKQDSSTSLQSIKTAAKNKKDKVKKSVENNPKIRYCYYLCLKKNLSFFSDLDCPEQEKIVDACMSGCPHPKILKNPHFCKKTGNKDKETDVDQQPSETGYGMATDVEPGQSPQPGLSQLTLPDDSTVLDGRKTSKWANIRRKSAKIINAPGSSYIKDRGLVFLFQGNLVATLTKEEEPCRKFSGYSIIGIETAMLSLPSVEMVRPDFSEDENSCQKIIYATVALDKIEEFLRFNRNECEKISVLSQNCSWAATVIRQQQKKLLSSIYDFLELPEILKKSLINQGQIEYLREGSFLDDSPFIASDLYFTVIYCGKIQLINNKRIYKISHPLVLNKICSKDFKIFEAKALCYHLPKVLVEGILGEAGGSRSSTAVSLGYGDGPSMTLAKNVDGNVNKADIIARLQWFGEQRADKWGDAEAVYLTPIEKYLLASKLAVETKSTNLATFKTLVEASKHLTFSTLTPEMNLWGFLYDIVSNTNGNDEAESILDPTIMVLNDGAIKFPNEGKTSRNFYDTVSKKEVDMVEGHICREKKVQVLKSHTVCHL